jgi:hypothetical protein
MAATAVFAMQAPLRRLDRCYHWWAPHQHQCVAMYFLFMAQLHFRKSHQLNQIYLQNCYILHRRRTMATATASRQAQATHQERTGPTTPAPNPAPSPTVEVAVVSVESGEEMTLVAPTTPPFTPATKNICDRSLPARCPAVSWSLDSDAELHDDVPLDDVHHTTDDHDNDTKTQDWPDTNSDPDQPWHPEGPYDPAYDVDSPVWNAVLWHTARGLERTQRLRTAYEKTFLKRHGTHDLLPRTEEFYLDWAWARVECNGTDYAQDYPDYCLDQGYETEYDSDLQQFLGSDCDGPWD